MRACAADVPGVACATGGQHARREGRHAATGACPLAGQNPRFSHTAPAFSAKCPALYVRNVAVSGALSFFRS